MSDDQGLDDLLDLLLEAQVLDRLPRTGYLMRGVRDAETVSEHSYQVTLLVWLLAERLEGIDRARALELALLHDLPEVRTGDLPLTSARFLPAGAKREAESKVAADLLGAAAPRALELLEEYREAKTPEALLVKACDKLQLMIKVSVYESWGEGDLRDFWANETNFRGNDIELVNRLYSALRDRREEG